MSVLLTADAMQSADRATIEEFGIPGFTLMETAARGCLAAIEERYRPLQSLAVTVLCGKGNNGGDGLALARLLYERGATVHAVTLGEGDELSQDARRNWTLLKQLTEADSSGRLQIYRFDSLTQLYGLSRTDLFVDALLGIGLSDELREPLHSIVDWLNEQRQPVLAIDIPTGLDADTGQVLGSAVRAELTCTMAARKPGHLFGSGSAVSGEVEVVDIGIPNHILERAATRAGSARLTNDEHLCRTLPERGPSAHKYSAGLVLAICGSPGLAGAPVMTSRAAARAGAGAVVCACPAPLQDALTTKLTEVMTLPLPVSDGALDPKRILDALAPRLDQAAALCIGPGLGRKPETLEAVRTVLREVDLPAVVDADGLHALAGHLGLLREREAPTICTPHRGEFSALAPDVDPEPPIPVVQKYAAEWNVVLLLKGLPSLVAAPDGSTYVAANASTAFASAGTGDILTGLTAGLLAQGAAPLDAAAAALHLGGLAAHRYTRTRHPHSMQATDLLHDVPYVLHDCLS